MCGLDGCSTEHLTWSAMIDWISAFAVLGQVVSTMRSLPSIFSGQVEGLAAFPTSCVYPEFVKATVRGFAEGAW